MNDFKLKSFPKTRIATIDICAIGKQKHQIAALLEVDVTVSREKIRNIKASGNSISFTAWLIHVISRTIKGHEQVAGYLRGKSKVLIFNNINVSIIVEKRINGQWVPVPLIIEKAHERSVESIARQIREAREKELTDKDIVLHARSGRIERAYYRLPGWVRRLFWKYLLNHPRLAFKKMGNVAITSVGMMGKVQGWFIPISVHPICFGISSMVKKPVVRDDKIEIRDILNMTVLIDHDVVDGAPMARFLSDLSENLEKGLV